jgi:uncharacterized phage protein (TIGR02220 family)
MKVNVKNINVLLDDALSLPQRGLLITILLLKDPDPKLTLAKVKAKVNMKEFKDDLIFLHERTFIVWSGYNQAKKSNQDKKLDPSVSEVISFMNDLYKRDFDSGSNGTITGLKQRLLSHSVEDIKKVIANRYSMWKDDPLMSKHLNPTTIFRASKFDKYLEEVNRTREGESFLNAKKIGLKDGDEITSEIAKTLVDRDNYSIRSFHLSKDGTREGNGFSLVKSGKDIKKSIKVRENDYQYGGHKSFEYIYKQK